MGYRLPDSSVHGISQARILERVVISFCGVSSQPRDQTRVSCIDRRILYHRATRGALPKIPPYLYSAIMYDSQEREESDQCKEIEGNNRMGKTRDLVKKIKDTKGFMQRWAQ